jgi:hypothetical protein
MKKVFFTMMLVALSSTWNLSKAVCMVPTNGIVTMMAPTDEYVTGVIEEVPMPCEQNNDPEYECPQCLTLAIRDNSDDRLFYLTTYQNPTVEAQLDSIMLVVSTLGSGLSATVSGFKYIPGYTTDSNKEYYSILVSSISTNPLRLKSLCDEWNMLGIVIPIERNILLNYKQQLTTDTTINNQWYVKLEQNGKHLGALREFTTSRISCIPAGSTHEYLLYAWDVQVGDKLSNLWIGGRPKDCPEGYTATITAISDDSPRVFTVEIDYPYINDDSVIYIPLHYNWVEGVGLPTGPIGSECAPNCYDDFGRHVLCAYKDGEHVYTSEWGEKYGCEYNSPEFQEQLLGMWQVYKQDVTDVYWDEEGVPSRETRTFNIDTEETCARIWHIEAKHIFEAGPCIDIRYPLPTYTLTALDNGTWQLTIPELYDLFVNDTTEAPSGTTPIIIHKLDENNMEWEYSFYRGDEGPTTYYQYLWRVGTQDNDTLPLYIRDGAGTSTVEPVDPNQIVATLVGDMLSIYEYIGAEIGYKVSKASPGNNMPARKRKMADDTFSESVSIQLKESGLYTLELTNPEWGYTIVGTFEYDGMQGIEPVETVVPAAQKILRDGQLLIRKGDRTYTVQGIELHE